MEKEDKTLKKENKVMGKELAKLRKSKPTKESDILLKSAFDPAVDGTPKSGRLDPEYHQAPPKNQKKNPGSPAAELGSTTAILKEKSKRRLLHKRKRGLITASKTSGVSASSFFQRNVNIDPRTKSRKSKRKKKKT